MVTASYMNTHVRDNLNALLATSAAVATDQTTTSTSYTDLATAGPAVTVTTGTKALIAISAQTYCGTIGQNQFMAVAVSGATTLAAADGNAFKDTAKVANYYAAGCRVFALTGLTAGSNTFTAKYRTTGGTAGFTVRDITVWPYHN